MLPHEKRSASATHSFSVASTLKNLDTMAPQTMCRSMAARKISQGTRVTGLPLGCKHVAQTSLPVGCLLTSVAIVAYGVPRTPTA